jgi:hypothetical protein
MAHQTTTNPIIFAHEGPLSGSSWTLTSETNIGRDVACDIQIPDRQVSRNHAIITFDGNGNVAIKDLNSKNGVFVNGERICDSAELKDGDTIKIALVQELIFVSSDATIPLDINIKPQEEPSLRLFIDQNARRVWMGEEELLPPLSVQQYNLLTLLYNSENKVVSRELIISEVWGDDAAIGVTEQALDALVRRLRGRLEKKDPTHSYITTVRGVGFIFQNSVY